MIWKYKWQDLDTGTPIQPYSDFYFQYAIEALENNSKGTIVELGVYDGCSGRIFYEVKENYPEAKLFLIDPVMRERTKELHMPENNLWFLEDKAEDVVKRFRARSIDLLHIDVDGEPAHNYDIQVMMHELYTPKLKKNCILIVHDFSEEYGCYEYGMEYLVNQSKKWDVIIPDKDPAFPSSRPIIARKLY